MMPVLVMGVVYGVASHLAMIGIPGHLTDVLRIPYTFLSQAAAGDAAATVLPPDDPELLVEERALHGPKNPRDKDGLVPLVAEVVSEGHSVLVFCSGGSIDMTV